LDRGIEIIHGLDASLAKSQPINFSFNICIHQDGLTPSHGCASQRLLQSWFAAAATRSGAKRTRFRRLISTIRCSP